MKVKNNWAFGNNVNEGWDANDRKVSTGHFVTHSLVGRHLQWWLDCLVVVDDDDDEGGDGGDGDDGGDDGGGDGDCVEYEWNDCDWTMTIAHLMMNIGGDH